MPQYSEGPRLQFDAEGNYVGGAENTEILLVVVHRRKPKTVYNSDFRLSFEELATKSGKNLDCTAYCCVRNPGELGAWFSDNNGTKLRGRDSKYVVIAFFVPANLQEVTLIFKSNVVGQFNVNK